VPLTWETLRIIAPVSLTLAFVGLLESLLTANLLDDITDTPSDKDRETRGQGIANIVSPLLGGMAGCAMIGQSMINVTSGGRGRLSTFWAGLFLLILILVLRDWVAQIPMAALVAVMIMVSIKTFDWNSVTEHPLHAGAVDHRDAGRHPDRAGHPRPVQGRGAGRGAQRDLLRPQGGQGARVREIRQR
jgi:MFS superfamily sulfate permease-like transporter